MPSAAVPTSREVFVLLDRHRQDAALGILSLLLIAWLAGWGERPQMVVSIRGFAQSLAAAPVILLTTAGDYQRNMVRSAPPSTLQPGTTSGQAILCSEPSSDYATAISTLVSAAAKGSAGKASGEVNGSASTTDTLIAMAGRSAGVVGLCDGLYAAFQAYANGIIGRDTYALVLSQYGDLLVLVVTAFTSSSPATSPARASIGAQSAALSSQVAAMQFHALQALLVTCLSAYDPTIHPYSAPTNRLLEGDCATLIGHIADASLSASFTAEPTCIPHPVLADQTRAGQTPASHRGRPDRRFSPNAPVSLVRGNQLGLFRKGFTNSGTVTLAVTFALKRNRRTDVALKGFAGAGVVAAVGKSTLKKFTVAAKECSTCLLTTLAQSKLLQSRA